MISNDSAGGTAIGDALVLATDNLKKARVKGRDQVIILVTDGESLQGFDPVQAASHVKNQDIRLYAIGMASETPTRVYIDGKPYINSQNLVLTTSLNDSQLKSIAAAADGRYYRATDGNVLSQLFERLATLEKSELNIQTVRQESDQSEPFIFSLFALLVMRWLTHTLYFRRPVR